jgi:hypothetical protein
MMFNEYVVDELRRADMLDEGIVKVGPDFRDGKYRANHLVTTKHNTRIQHFKNGNYIETLMDAEELRKRHLAQKNIAQKKRDIKMEMSKRKRLVTMMRRRMLGLQQQDDVKMPTR